MSEREEEATRERERGGTHNMRVRQKEEREGEAATRERGKTMKNQRECAVRGNQSECAVRGNE